MAEIPTGDWSWINEAAERFEQAWKKGPRPRIEDFLAREPEPRRPPLLSELLRVECELRVKAGETLTHEEYRRRFPGHDNVVASVFAQAPASSRLRSVTSTGAVYDVTDTATDEHDTPRNLPTIPITRSFASWGTAAWASSSSPITKSWDETRC